MFSAEEREEVRRLVRKCFKGKGTEADSRRCDQLRLKSPAEYTLLASTVRAEVRDEMRSW